ncbi:MAG TPA: thioredoxin fold domain-containing protein [Verrucomicrobiales bacterium]|nr:thioredoxin fold domain-containing protein [Verrucomicrobiales bacterium]
MKPLRTSCSALLFAALAPVSLLPAAEGWERNFAGAKALASKEDKDLLVDFTGSDWCGWCIKLDEEVFSKAAFKEAAPKNFVLVTLDFPRDPSKVTDAERDQNEKLQVEYGVQGFPTIFLCDSKGRPYAQTGYQPGGADSYVAHLDELRKTRIQRDEKFAAAEKAEGLEKATLLVEALKTLPESALTGFYAAEIAQVKELDQDDSTGFVRKQDFQAASEKLMETLTAAQRAGDLEAGVKAVDDFLANQKPEGMERQETMLYKLGFLMELGKVDEALKLLDDAIAVDPGTPVAAQALQIKPRIQEIQDAAGKEDQTEPAQDAAEE